MARYFAEVINGKVIRVIVAEPDFINSGKVGNPENWIETFIDRSKGYNYAGIGFSYDKDANAFIPEKPVPEAVLDTKKFNWVIPEPAAVLSGSSTSPQ